MIKVAAKHGLCENFLWNTDFRIKRKRIFGKKKTDLQKELRRCLTMEELCKIAKLIFYRLQTDRTKDGFAADDGLWATK